MAAGQKRLGINTQLVHAGERGAPPQGKPVSTPIYASATFTYDSMAEVDQVFSGEKQGYIYSRYGNPTVAVLEEAVQVLEEGAAACAYSTGMAALHAAIFACEATPGATILASQDLYGATIDLLYKVLGPYGIKTATADFSDVKALRAKALEVGPRVLIAETISNPLLKVCDIAACAEIAREAGARFIVDNTFTSPYLCKPLKHGADFSVHSATKYLGGHADVMGGIVVARDEVDLPALIGVMKLVGGVLGVWEAHEIHRGLKTLSVRMDRQCDNALRLAKYLENHEGVSRVYYPGLAPPQNQETIKRMVRLPHFGALVSIELRQNTREAAFRFMDALSLCVRSTSLGDVFTGVLHPATASHREVAPARRQQLGISEGLVRISVGIEDVTDIIDDIEQALEANV
ncbi:MAG: PLP-dependent aspartate aminotransferase family protein [Acidobacteriota bacterium]|nr:PLP-dependent aspartate aminotransferase family protein [Acidobacteriota bacterium]